MEETNKKEDAFEEKFKTFFEGNRLTISEQLNHLDNSLCSNLEGNWVQVYLAPIFLVHRSFLLYLFEVVQVL